MFVIILLILLYIAFLMFVVRRSANLAGENKNNKKTKKSVDDAEYFTPVLAMAEGVYMVFARQKLENFLLKDYYVPESLFKIKVANKLSAQKELEKVLLDILQFLGLPPLVQLIIEYDDEVNNAAGKTQAGSYQKTTYYYRSINIKIQRTYRPINILAILCHECTHYFMEFHKLNWNDTELNEQRTDVVANLIGFNNIMAEGYREFKSFQNGKSIVHKIGYITDKDCYDISYFLDKCRGEIIKNQETKELLSSLKENLKNRLEVAKTLAWQLQLIDIKNLKVQDTEQVAQIQKALYEIEACDISNEILKYETSLNEQLDTFQAEKENQKIEEFCSKLISWLSVLQGNYQ